MKTLQILRRIAFPLMLLALLVLSACAEHPTGSGPAGTGPDESVSGILNDEHGFIVPGATVKAIAADNSVIAADVSTEEGAFVLKGLPKDLTGVRLAVSQESFRPFTSELPAIIGMAGGPTGVIVSVQHEDSCCAHLTVHVTGTGGVTLEGVEVRLRRGDRLITTGTTDGSGNIVFSNVCGGELNLRLSKTGYQVAERGGIRITGCDSTRVEFSMRAAGNDHNGERDTCCNGKLRIQPLDSATGAHLSGASIRISKTGFTTRTATSNGDGVTFRELCEGTYNIRIAKDGYRVVEFSVTIHCNDSVYTDRRLAPNGNGGGGGDTCCNGRIQITVRDSTGNVVLGGVSVVLRKGDRTWTATSSNDGGRAVFEGLCNGDYTIVLEKTGYVRQEQHVGLDCNGRAERTYTMGRSSDSCCGGRITIIVRDSSSNAVISNATVRLWRGGALFRTGTTNGDGRVVFENLCQGNYGIDFTREGYGGREMSITLGCNENREISVRLLHNTDCCNAVFRFRVKDSAVAEGGWQSGVTVTVTRGNDAVGTGTTNGDGLVVFEHICGGNRTYTVTFSKDGFVTKTLQWTITECRTVEETVRIVRH